MSALCTDQSKKQKHTHTKKIYKVQCLDVYELFDDCVEHDHFLYEEISNKRPWFCTRRLLPLGDCLVGGKVWDGAQHPFSVRGPMCWDGAGTGGGSASCQGMCSWLGVESGAGRDELSLFAFPQGWCWVHKGISLFPPNLQVRSAPPPSGPSWVN